MAAVEVTITGLLYDKLNRTTQNVVLIGEASLTNVGIGGGPVYPPVQPPQQPPVGIWPGPGPIFPPGWGPGGEHPAHPIVLPPPGGGGGPGVPPIEPPQPPIQIGGNWDWGWSPAHGWHPVYVPGDKPKPIPPPPGGGNGKPPIDPGLHPEHPIVLPPEQPPVDPNAPHPEHPIVNP